jgi:hypothetical protein
MIFILLYPWPRSREITPTRFAQTLSLSLGLFDDKMSTVYIDGKIWMDRTLFSLSPDLTRFGREIEAADGDE